MMVPDSAQRIRVLGVDVDRLTLDQTTARICSWLAAGESAHDSSVPQKGRYVVTPNLDHAVQLRDNVALKKAYEGAALVVADGAPLVLASRLHGQRLPERVAGSDLTPLVLKRAPSGCRVFLLGGSDLASERAAAKIAEDYPQLKVAGRLSPPLGFQLDPEWNQRIVREIQDAGAQLVLIGLGAPKQELWIAEHHALLPGTVALCVGATIDFIAGTVIRAPRWAQRSGVEWLHRLLSDPGRLTKRYAKDALYFPYLLASDFALSRRRRAAAGSETSVS